MEPTLNADSKLQTLTAKLPTHFSLKDCERDEFWKLVGDQVARVFDDNELIFQARGVFSEEEKNNLVSLGENFKFPFFNHLVLLHQGELAGWM